MTKPTNDAVRETPVFATFGAAIALRLGAAVGGQQVPPTSAFEIPEVQAIVVTGSMIRGPNAETAEAVCRLDRPEPR